MEWKPIETAPKDGTHFLGYNGDETYSFSNIKETWMDKYAEGSIGYAKWIEGEIPRNSGWGYIERDAFYHWKPTHWMPMPEYPK